MLELKKRGMVWDACVYHTQSMYYTYHMYCVGMYPSAIHSTSTWGTRAAGAKNICTVHVCGIGTVRVLSAPSNWSQNRKEKKRNSVGLWSRHTPVTGKRCAQLATMECGALREPIIMAVMPVLSLLTPKCTILMV